MPPVESCLVGACITRLLLGDLSFCVDEKLKVKMSDLRRYGTVYVAFHAPFSGKHRALVRGCDAGGGCGGARKNDRNMKTQRRPDRSIAQALAPADAGSDGRGSACQETKMIDVSELRPAVAIWKAISIE